MSPRPFVSLALLGLLAGAGGCGGRTDDASPGGDTGAVVDAADGGTDAARDVIFDVTADASSPIDAVADGLAPVAAPGHVSCGAAGVCDLSTQICCEKADGADLGTPSCVTGTTCPGRYDAIIACEKQSDCTRAGEVCCGSIGLNGNLHASCAADCGTAAQRCSTSAECIGGLACEVHTCAGSHVLRVCGYPKTWCS
jgi:hypothetical protein